jgi:hypothetical protein
MEKMEYKSLEWIHRVREDNYLRTKGLSPVDLIEKTKQTTDQTIKKLGLSIASSKHSPVHIEK